MTPMNSRVSMITLSAATAAMLSLAGCGGGGGTPTADNSPSTVTGTFVDGPVAGVTYECSSGTTGKTDASGAFTCNVGDTVTFKVGATTLGTAAVSSGEVTPYTLYPLNPQAALNIAQLLQSLDADGDLAEGQFTIDTDREAEVDIALDVTADDFDAQATAMFDTVTLVDESSAQEHLDSSVASVPAAILSGDITADMTLTSDKVWILDGLVTVTNGATLTVQPGTTIAGKDGTGDLTSYMIVDKGAKIIADGTAAEPIIFTSELALRGEPAAWGQWGGLTIIGNAAMDTQVAPYEVNTAFVPGMGVADDNSGVLRHVKILNSGITMELDKEINGLSLVGVGSGTTIEDITVDLSDDDGIEIWGGTVNLTNVTVTRCSDDHFDIDDGYSGTVTNLNITQTTGNAGIEMSGDTHATFDTFNIVQNHSAKEGGIFFKKAGIGGHFLNGTITDNFTDGYGTIHSQDTADIANTSFENVTLNGTATDAKFTNTTDEATDSAAELEAVFTSGTGNTIN